MIDGYYDGFFRHTSGNFRLGTKMEMTDYPVTMTDADLDPIRKKILALAAEKRMSLRELSKTIGKKPGYLNDYIRKGSPVSLDVITSMKLADEFGVPATELGIEFGPAAVLWKDVATHNQTSVSLATGTKSYLEQPRDLPILGSVKAGTEGFFLDNGEVHGMARRPPILQGVAGAFAVYVHDDCMVPAYEPGWLVHVHPKRPVKPGDNVVIEMHDGQAFLKRLVKRTEKHVLCKQWNPVAELKFDASKVKTIMLVVGSSIEE